MPLKKTRNGLPAQSTSKYKNKKAVYNGETYDSQKEARYAKALDTFKKAINYQDRVLKWERQVRYDIKVNDERIAFYKLDFKVWYCDGRVEHIDIKGQKSGTAYQLFKLKKKLIEALYNIEIIEV